MILKVIVQIGAKQVKWASNKHMNRFLKIAIQIKNLLAHLLNVQIAMK